MYRTAESTSGSDEPEWPDLARLSMAAPRRPGHAASWFQISPIPPFHKGRLAASLAARPDIAATPCAISYPFGPPSPPPTSSFTPPPPRLPLGHPQPTMPSSPTGRLNVSVRPTQVTRPEAARQTAGSRQVDTRPGRQRWRRTGTRRWRGLQVSGTGGRGTQRWWWRRGVGAGRDSARSRGATGSTQCSRHSITLKSTPTHLQRRRIRSTGASHSSRVAISTASVDAARRLSPLGRRTRPTGFVTESKTSHVT